MRHFHWIIVLLLLASSCDLYTDDDLVIDKTEGKIYSLLDRYSDKNGNEGIVVDVYTAKSISGKTLIRICVLSIDEESLPWGVANVLFYNLPENEKSPYAYGLWCTQIALECGISDFPAFNWCYQKNNCKKGDVPELGDWTLPSSYEFFLIQDNIEIINNYLERHNLPTLKGYYWCADYYSNNRALVWSSSESKYFHTTKEKSFSVRAIKYIYLQ